MKKTKSHAFGQFFEHYRAERKHALEELTEMVCVVLPHHHHGGKLTKISEREDFF